MIDEASRHLVPDATDCKDHGGDARLGSSAMLSGSFPACGPRRG
ncbi:hypothetical protein ACFFX0_23100 [Citricoccus parietis]|uniref:Uncharacterized protein n=1 Tax=Citricoccus parietis TaxID=592307 RepID=A0ABV5G4S7_9MICC